MNVSPRVIIAVAFAAVLGIGIPVVHADHVISSNVACDGDACMEVWNLQCKSAQTNCAQARACATSALPFADRAAIVIAGYSPLVLIGKGDISVSPLGGCTAFVEVCRAVTSKGPVKALIRTTSPSSFGSMAYDLIVRCNDKDGNSLPSATHTITKTLDQ